MSSSSTPEGPDPASSSQEARRGLSRRTFIGGAAAVAAAASLSNGWMRPAAASIGMPTPRGLGSVSGAPHLPAGFWKTFTSRYIRTGGLRQHVVMEGEGPPLLLVHGWPETWSAWRLVMPALARDFSVVAVDQRGIGLSDIPADGYDSGTLGDDLVKLMDALGHPRFALAGHDTGLPISYALAADHRDRVEALAVAEAAPPGVGMSRPMWLPAPANDRAFHLMFNHLPTMNDELVRGREDIFFGFEFDIQAGTTKLPGDVVRYYIDILRSRRHALQGSFGWYRALDVTIAQNQQRVTRKLTIPVLAIGGEQSLATRPAEAMALAADKVQTLVIPGCGHWVMEQAPKELLAALTAFLAPYRAAHNAKAQAAVP
jgi:pimeloyl-ACP methyl ester carboxylesterase